MQSLCGITVSRMGLFFGVEAPKVNNLFVVSDLRLPTPIRLFHPRQTTNALQSMTVAVFAIGSVLTMSCLPKVLKPIVGAIPINVVNLLSRHRTGYMEPNQSVGRIVLPINFKVYVSLVMKVASLIPNPNFRSWAVPMKESGIRIVPEQCGEFGVCNHADILPGFVKDCND